MGTINPSLSSQITASEDTMSHRVFLCAISIFSVVSLLAIGGGAAFSMNWVLDNAFLKIGHVLVFLFISLLFALLARSYSDAKITAIGGTFCAFIFGVLIGPLVPSTEDLSQAIILTCAIAVLTGLLCMLMKDDAGSFGVPGMATLLCACSAFIVMPRHYDGEFSLSALSIIGIVLFNAVMSRHLYKVLLSRRKFMYIKPATPSEAVVISYSMSNVTKMAANIPISIIFALFRLKDEPERQ